MSAAAWGGNACLFAPVGMMEAAREALSARVGPASGPECGGAPCGCTVGRASAADPRCASPRVVVLGVGNALLSDDGLGVRVISELAANYLFPPQVTLIDGGISGMELLDDLAGVDHLVIIDAVRAGKAPGGLVHLTGEQVPVFFAQKLTPHQIGLSDVLATLRLMEEEPGRTVVVGVQPVSLELSMDLTAPVEARLPEVIGLVLSELHGLGVAPRLAA